MIYFDEMEARKDNLRLSYLVAHPFPHLAIYGFCNEGKLLAWMYDPAVRIKNKLFGRSTARH